MEEHSSWRLVYEHLVLTESHWTAQLQNQQQRNSSILAVNGFLLGFSGFTGAMRFQGEWADLGAIMFAVGLASLALAIVAEVISTMAGSPSSSSRTW